MKRKISGFFLLMVIAGLLFSSKADKNIKEKIEVINVVIPLRVFLKGQPVDHLSKHDFLLYENKKLQIINECVVKRKKIKAVLEGKKRLKTEPKGRYFILIFWISEYNKKIKEGIDFLFTDIFTKKDQLMISVNNKTYFFNNLDAKEECLLKLGGILQKESQVSRQNMHAHLQKIEKEMDQLKTIMTQKSSSSPSGYKIYLKSFLERYLEILYDYRNKYLMPQPANYYFYASKLKKIKKEKWVLYFYQSPLFPTFSSKSKKWLWEVIGELQARDRPEDLPYTTVLRRLLNEIDTVFQVAKSFPSEKISKLFYTVETTFHSIIMPFHKEILSEEFEYKGLSTDIENCLRELTKKTGGSIIVSNNVQKGINTLQEKEDVYYILTYAPKNPGNIGKLKIVPKNRNYKIIYNANIKENSLLDFEKKTELIDPDVKIEKIIYKNNKLHIRVTDFLIKKIKNDQIGNLVVQVIVRNRTGKKIFDQTKNVITKKNSLDITINFSRLQKGQYDFVVDVLDKFTEKKVVDSLHSVSIH